MIGFINYFEIYHNLLNDYFFIIEVPTFLYIQMMEDAVHFLSKETVVQTIARSATKVCNFFNEIAGPYYACIFILCLC